MAWCDREEQITISVGGLAFWVLPSLLAALGDAILFGMRCKYYLSHISGDYYASEYCMGATNNLRLMVEYLTGLVVAGIVPKMLDRVLSMTKKQGGHVWR